MSIAGYSFGERSPAEQRRLLWSSAEEILKQYPLKDVEFTLLQFEDNAVYLVKSGWRRYVLRVSVTDGRSPAEQASEIAWMEALAAEGGTTEVGRPTGADGPPVTPRWSGAGSRERTVGAEHPFREAFGDVEVFSEIP